MTDQQLIGKLSKVATEEIIDAVQSRIDQRDEFSKELAKLCKQFDKAFEALLTVQGDQINLLYKVEAQEIERDEQ